MKKRLMIVAVMVSLLSGCMVGPKYRRPVVRSPDVFRGTADPAAAPDPNSLADLKWFEVFKDERLQDLIRTALAANYDLREAVARVNAARANLGVTRADQFPNITAGADLTTLRNSSSGSFPNGFNLSHTLTRPFCFLLASIRLVYIEIQATARRE